MLYWFAKRLREMQEVRRDEWGFTLIELLVVVIIIGILAAIAIPVFLSQRDKAADAAAQSALRNAGTAQTAYYADNGKFTGTITAQNGPNNDLTDYGFRQGDPPVQMVNPPTGGTADSYCMKADGGTGTFFMSDTSGRPTATACT